MDIHNIEMAGAVNRINEVNMEKYTDLGEKRNTGGVPTDKNM